MGHVIDRLGYNKASNDDQWVWGEISKIHGPAAVTEDALTSRDAKIEQVEIENKDLRARLERLEAISVERLVLAAATKKQATPHKQKQST
jgi:hypothetical protein